MKIAIITCYDQNDYIRARTLRTALQNCPGVEAIIIKNRHKGLWRYIEVPYKIIAAKFTKRPDAYLITFRGYEMLPLTLLIKGRKPLIFDEMLNPGEYLAEHGRLNLGKLPGRLFVRWYAWLLKRCRFVLADTEVHAKYSAWLCRLAIEKYRVLPISSDETVFYPRSKPNQPENSFEVFYYGNGMIPLHGLGLVLEAAVLLKDKPEIKFTIVGGRQKAEQACAEAVKRGARITYKAWIPFEDIPVYANRANLCLGGPFGKTLQAQFVITGKTYQFLACKCPVLVGANEATGLFKDKVNCLLVPQGDSEGIAEAVAWAASHPQELDDIADAGHKLYQAHFSQNVVDEQIRELISKI